MGKEIFIEGKPKFFLEDYEHNTRVAAAYGRFSFDVYQEVEALAPDLPQDLLLTGDNWYQLSGIGRWIRGAYANYIGSDGRKFYIGYIRERTGASPIKEVFEEARNRLRFGNDDMERILEGLTVIDRSSVGFPAISRTDILLRTRDETWGRIIWLKGWEQTKIYYIKDF